MAHFNFNQIKINLNSFQTKFNHGWTRVKSKVENE